MGGRKVKNTHPGRIRVVSFRKSVNEPIAEFGGRNLALMATAKPAISMPTDEVVYGIAEEWGNNNTQVKERPASGKPAGDPECCGRSGINPVSLQEHNRVQAGLQGRK